MNVLNVYIQKYTCRGVGGGGVLAAMIQLNPAFDYVKVSVVSVCVCVCVSCPDTEELMDGGVHNKVSTVS